MYYNRTVLIFKYYFGLIMSDSVEGNKNSNIIIKTCVTAVKFIVNPIIVLPFPLKFEGPHLDITIIHTYPTFLKWKKPIQK